MLPTVSAQYVASCQALRIHAAETYGIANLTIYSLLQITAQPLNILETVQLNYNELSN
jgi:hypothetical protein